MTTLVCRIAALLTALWLSVMPADCREPHWPETLAIGTASPGGTYFTYGEGLARILTRELRTTVWARPSEGPSENIKLLETGGIQLAFVTLGVAQQGWNGTGTLDRGGPAPCHARNVPNVRYAVPVRGAAELRDRDGRRTQRQRIGMGPQGGTIPAYLPDSFQGAEPGRDVRHRRLVRSHLAGAGGLVRWAPVAARCARALVCGPRARPHKVRYLPLAQN